MRTQRTEIRDQRSKTNINKKIACHCECKRGNLKHIFLSTLVLTILLISCGGKSTTFVNKQKSDAIDMILQGNESFREGKYKQSAKYYDRARLIAISIDDLKVRSDADINLGHLYLTAKDYENAVKKFEEAKKWSGQIDYSAGITASLNGLGVVYMERGNCDKGKNYFDKALELKPDKFLMAGILSNLGEINQRCKDSEQALKYLFEADSIARKGKKHMLVSTINYRIANVYKSISELDKALIHAEIALDEDKNVEHVYGIFRDLELISQIHFLKGDIDLASIYSKRAKEVEIMLFGNK